MGIGTSLGAFYRDEGHYAASKWDDRYDDNVVKPEQQETNKKLDDAEVSPSGPGLPIGYWPPSEDGFSGWKSRNAPNDSGADYDLKGAYNAGVVADERGHMPDTFKLPNHITFSNESMYHGKDGNEGGQWQKIGEGKDDNWSFTPSKTNLANHSEQELKDYFAKYEPNSKLNLDTPSKGFFDRLSIMNAVKGMSNPSFGEDITMLKGLYETAKRGLTLPGEVASGKVDPSSTEAIDRAADLAMMAVGGSVTTAGKGTLGSGVMKGATLEKDLAEVMAPHEVKEIMEQYKQVPFEGGDYFVKQPKQSYLPQHLLDEENMKTITDLGSMHHLKIQSGEHAGEETWAGQGWHLTKPADANAKNWYLEQGNNGKFLKKDDAINYLLDKDAEATVKPGKNDAYIDMFLKGHSNKVEELLKKDDKLSFKEAFLRAAEETHAAFTTTAANIKAKFVAAAKEPDNLVKAGKKGYDQPAYRGVKLSDNELPNPVHSKVGERSMMYSSDSPLLADMYSSYLTSHPGVNVPEGTFREGASVMPLYIDTRNYHYYDAKGGSWEYSNGKAIGQAMDMKKHGVIVDNVWDEPSSTKALGSPKKVFITFPEGAHTVKSRFAKKFDPTSENMLHGIGIGGPAGYVSVQDLSGEDSGTK